MAAASPAMSAWTSARVASGFLGAWSSSLACLALAFSLRISCELGAALSPLVGLGLDLGVVVSLGLGLGILLLEGPVGGGDLLGSQGRAVRSWCGSGLGLGLGLVGGFGLGSGGLARGPEAAGEGDDPSAVPAFPFDDPPLLEDVEPLLDEPVTVPMQPGALAEDPVGEPLAEDGLSGPEVVDQCGVDQPGSGAVAPWDLCELDGDGDVEVAVLGEEGRCTHGAPPRPVSPGLSAQTPTAVPFPGDGPRCMMVIDCVPSAVKGARRSAGLPMRSKPSQERLGVDGSWPFPFVPSHRLVMVAQMQGVRGTIRPARTSGFLSLLTGLCRLNLPRRCGNLRNLRILVCVTNGVKLHF